MQNIGDGDDDVITHLSKFMRVAVLDAGAFIASAASFAAAGGRFASLQSLIASFDEAITCGSVVSEVRDESSRERLQSMLLRGLTVREPSAAAIAFATAFATRTGDLSAAADALSAVDISVIALAVDTVWAAAGKDALRSAPQRPVSRSLSLSTLS